MLSSANNNSVLLPLQSLCLVVVVSCLTAPARTPGVMLDRCMDEGQLVFSAFKECVSVALLGTVFLLGFVDNLD